MKTRPRNGLIGALDVGATKVCCFIARVLDDGALRVIGFNHRAGAGSRAGVVVDMEAAEQMAETRIEKVLVNLSGGGVGSSSISVELAVGGHEIGENDIRRIQSAGRTHAAGDGETELIHAIPTDYAIDGAHGVRDPRGMIGDRLGVTLNLVTAAAGPVRNLSTVIRRCHLEPEAVVASPFASGLACLVEDEKQLGVTVIDMGGGTTTIGVFLEGRLAHVDSLPVGGGHVTNDIARGLSTPLARAERLKTLYGSAMASPADDREMLTVPLVGEDDDTDANANQVPRSMLVQIIQPRIEETFELVRAHLEACGLDKQAGRRVVLTGGASQLQGLREIAAMILDKQVRLGRPPLFKGLPESMSGAPFATCAGLLRFAAGETGDIAARPEMPADRPTGTLGRIGQWLRQNF